MKPVTAQKLLAFAFPVNRSSSPSTKDPSLCCHTRIRVTSPIFCIPLLPYSWRSILETCDNPLIKSSHLAAIYNAIFFFVRISPHTPLHSQRRQTLIIMLGIDKASCLAYSASNLGPTILPDYSATASPLTGISSLRFSGLCQTWPGSHDAKLVEVKTTPSEAGQFISPTSVETSGENKGCQELSPAEIQKIVGDILSVPSFPTDGDENNSCFLETAIDLLEVFFTLGSVYFTFHIYRSVHDQGFQTESNTSQERPMIKQVEKSSPDEWERHKKLLKQFNHEYSLTKCQLKNLSDDQTWNFYWVLQKTQSIPKRVACFWAEPASLQREAELNL